MCNRTAEASARAPLHRERETRRITHRLCLNSRIFLQPVLSKDTLSLKQTRPREKGPFRPFLSVSLSLTLSLSRALGCSIRVVRGNWLLCKLVTHAPRSNAVLALLRSAESPKQVLKALSNCFLKTLLLLLFFRVLTQPPRHESLPEQPSCASPAESHFVSSPAARPNKKRKRGVEKGKGAGACQQQAHSRNALILGEGVWEQDC